MSKSTLLSKPKSKSKSKSNSKSKSKSKSKSITRRKTNLSNKSIKSRRKILTVSAVNSKSTVGKSTVWKKQINSSERKGIGIETEKYLESLTKFRPQLDVKFYSSPGKTSELNKIKLDVQPFQVDNLNELREKIFSIQSCQEIYKYLTTARHKKTVLILDGFTRGVSNLINEKYPQLHKISNAYVKLWEIYETFKWLIPKKSTTRRVNIFHMAEAPGQWINTTNHYFYQHIPKHIKYNWYANTLNPKHPRMKGIINALPDNYGFIKQNPQKWLYGADGSGDITVPANVAWFNNYLLNKLPSGLDDNNNLDIITGDAGTSHTETNIELLQRIDVSQSIVVACTARQGSNCVIKHFSPYLKSKSTTKMADGFFISFMYLYHLLFSEFHMFKPLASSPGSGEFYVVARGFHGITPTQRELLLEYLTHFALNKPMFRQNDIPSEFVKRVSTFITELHQIVMMNDEMSCKLIDYCYGPGSNNKTDDCNFVDEPHKFTDAKNQDLEAYIDRYHIARIDKLRKHHTYHHTHTHPHTHKHKHNNHHRHHNKT